MPLPVIHINITASVVAAYAAVVSTITALVQGSNYLRDRARIRIRVAHNMMIVGARDHYMNRKLTVVYVTNAGRRPVTIKGVSGHHLDRNLAFLIPDTRPRQCPCELTEGQELMAIFDPEDMNLSSIESYEVGLTTGRPVRLNVVPWYRAWLSHRRRKKDWQREAKEKRLKESLTKKIST